MGKGCRVYNPNKYDKKHCGLECSVDGYHCRKHPFHPIRRPTNGDCWQSSYRWHVESPFLWGTPAVPTVMAPARMPDCNERGVEAGGVRAMNDLPAWRQGQIVLDAPVLLPTAVEK